MRTFRVVAPRSGHRASRLCLRVLLIAGVERRACRAATIPPKRLAVRPSQSLGMFDPVQSARLTAGGELADRKFGGRGVREEASTGAVLWGRGGECGVCAGSSRAHKYSAETYTESVQKTSVQDRSRVSPAFGAKPGERECVCVGELFFGEGGESAEFAQDRGGGIALGITRTRRIQNLYTSRSPRR